MRLCKAFAFHKYTDCADVNEMNNILVALIKRSYSERNCKQVKESLTSKYWLNTYIWE